MAVPYSFFQSKLNRFIDFLSVDITKYKEGSQFAQDFYRTSEVRLLVNKKEQLYYVRDNFKESKDLNSEVEKVKNQFIKILKDISPELEITIKTMMHQAGPFYSGRNVLENVIFPRVGIRGRGHKHKFIVEINAYNEVTVREISMYNSLQLDLPEFAKNIFFSREGIVADKLTREQQQALEDCRELNISLYLASGKTNLQEQMQEDYLLKNDSQVFGDEGFVKLDQSNIDKDFSFGRLELSEPFSLTVEYKLSYDLDEKKFKLVKPSETDIDIKFPAKLVEKLIYTNFNKLNNEFENITVLSKVQEQLVKLIAKLVEAVKKAFVIAIDELFNDRETVSNNHFSYYMDRPRI